jgi:hypothetical protein
MTAPLSRAPLGEVRNAILAMASRLEDTHDLPQAGIADLKNAVDDVRIRLWGMIMAGDESDYEGFAGRFRMRRAAECCRGIEQDLTAGRIRPDSDESKMLHVAARQLVSRLEPGAIPARPSKPDGPTL